MTNTQKKYHYLYPPFDYEKRNFRGFSYSNKYIIGLIDNEIGIKVVQCKTSFNINAGDCLPKTQVSAKS